MRVAYLTSQYPAPSHTFIRREVEALRARGVSIDTFSIRPPKPSELGDDADRRAFATTWYSLPVHPVSLLVAHLTAVATSPLRYFAALRLALRHRVPGFRAFVWALFHFAEAIELARELGRRRIDRVHSHFANSSANVGVIASSYLGVPWSITLHGISEFDYPAGPVLPDKLRRAVHVACASHFVRAQAMRVVEPEHWSKMFISRCGVELSLLPSSDPPESRRRPRLLCVGRLSPEKGHAGLLLALRAALDRGFDAELVIVGDGPDHGWIVEQIRELDLGRSVVLRGRLAEREVFAEMARADLLVSGSLMEGLPVVLMEAFGIGLPVIAPRVAGIPELVEDGVSGWLFHPGDWSNLTAVIQTALRCRTLWAPMGLAGQKRVFAEFAIERAVVPLLGTFGHRPGDSKRPSTGPSARTAQAPTPDEVGDAKASA